jgi:hypothetical protein
MNLRITLHFEERPETEIIGTEKEDRVMMRFCGYDLELLVDNVVRRDVWPTVCQARDPGGGRWLIVQIVGEPNDPAWLCAPVSEHALQAVLLGGSSPLDAVRHSTTGIAELVVLSNGSATPDRCLLGGQVNELLAALRPPSVESAA